MDTPYCGTRSFEEILFITLTLHSPGGGGVVPRIAIETGRIEREQMGGGVQLLAQSLPLDGVRFVFLLSPAAPKTRDRRC